MISSEFDISFHFRKYVKIGGNKIVPMKKTKPGTVSVESVESDKQTLLETFPKPE